MDTSIPLWSKDVNIEGEEGGLDELWWEGDSKLNFYAAISSDVIISVISKKKSW